MNADLQAIFNKVQDWIRAKVKPNPDPDKVSAAHTAEILENIITEIEKGSSDYREVATLNDLYDIALNDPGSLELYKTRIFVVAEQNEYRLTDLTEADNALGWEDTGETTDAAKLITGILADARLSGNIPRLNTFNEFTGFMLLVNNTPTHPVFGTSVSGEDFSRVEIYADGGFRFSNGTDPVFVFLKKGNNDSLETDGKFNAIAGLQHKGADLLAYKTGTVVDFVAMETHFGTEAVPETGNITANITDAVAGHMAFMTHNNGTAPTFSSEFHKLAGSGDYVTGQKNYIYFDYRSATRINYSITQ